jgi:hypothetical protein
MFLVNTKNTNLNKFLGKKNEKNERKKKLIMKD